MSLWTYVFWCIKDIGKVGNGQETPKPNLVICGEAWSLKRLKKGHKWGKIKKTRLSDGLMVWISVIRGINDVGILGIDQEPSEPKMVMFGEEWPLSGCFASSNAFLDAKLEEMEFECWNDVMDMFNIMFEVCLKKKTSERMIEKRIEALPDEFWMNFGENVGNSPFWSREIDPLW